LCENPSAFLLSKLDKIALKIFNGTEYVLI
jgi:hypothetical protein